MGVVRVGDNGEDYYNSILALTRRALAFYDKRHLVPFARILPGAGRSCAAGCGC